MKPKRVKLIVLLLLSFVLEGAIAQKTITSAGGKASGDGGSIAYTVGLVSYISTLNTSGSVIQGVQIPYEISIILGFDNKDIDLGIAVYPNPTTHYLILTVNSVSEAGSRYLLFNSNGDLLQTNPIMGKETFIDMLKFPSSEYYLQVTKDDAIKTFKIIKK